MPLTQLSEQTIPYFLEKIVVKCSHLLQKYEKNAKQNEGGENNEMDMG